MNLYLNFWHERVWIYFISGAVIILAVGIVVGRKNYFLSHRQAGRQTVYTFKKFSVVLNRIEKRLDVVLQAVKDLENCEEETTFTEESLQENYMKDKINCQDSISFENIDLLKDESPIGNPSDAENIPSGNFRGPIYRPIYRHPIDV